jgi:dihydro-heme d1 dehydrogenase
VSRLGLLVLAIALVGCSVGRPAEDATGEEIYAQLCSRCHGADLSGAIGPSLGPGSLTAAETDEFLEFTIVHGRGRMPSFESSLDETQMDRLIAYIREVQAE